MKHKKVFGVFLFAIACLFLLPRLCSASIYFFDDKLRVKGTIYEFIIYGTDLDRTTSKYRTTNLGLMRTKGTLELLYKLQECENRLINVFGFFHWWHESVPDIDSKYRRSIDNSARKRFQGPYEDQDDWINELYVDYYQGPWNIRLGKQIIFWSEVELVRTIDQVNQLDLRYTTPGIDPWDEIKLGLWMIRGFYNSQLPGQLIFEWMWIPGDFEQVRIPVEGTYWGSRPAPPYDLKEQPVAYGQSAAVADMFRYAKPQLALDNSMFALRVRGNSEITVAKTAYLLDWTISWFHGMNNTPVAKRKYLGAPTAFNLDPDTINGFLNNLAFRRVGGFPLIKVPNRRWWEFKYYDIVGASVQTYIPAIRGVLRGEIAYEIGTPKLKADPDTEGEGYVKPITGTTERDVLNLGFTYDVPIAIRWIQERQHRGIRCSGVFDTSFGYFRQEKIGDVRRIRETFGYKQRSQDNFTLTVRGNIRQNEFIPVLRALWNTNKWGYVAFALRYTPGKHFRYEGGYQFFHARNVWDSREAQTKYKDCVYFRAGYEF